MFDCQDIADDARQVILGACSRVEYRLSLYLGASMSVSIANGDDLEKADQLWGRKPLDWRSNPFYKTDNLRRFTVSIKAGSQILGLCRSSNKRNDRKLILERVQSERDRPHPMRGNAIAAFSEVNLEIARAFGLNHISVESPLPSTLPKYEAAGFDTEYSTWNCCGKAELAVNDNTSVSWPMFCL